MHLYLSRQTKAQLDDLIARWGLTPGQAIARAIQLAQSKKK